MHNYMLPHPELYNLLTDPDESYDVAPENPKIVAEIRAKVDEMIRTFPPEVQTAYNETLGRKTNPTTPAGAYPRPAAR